MFDKKKQKILLTGASGYIGGQLLKKLQQKNYKLRCLFRPEHKISIKISENTEIARGDVLDKKSLEEAFIGIDIAYYLIHSMGEARGFVEKDRVAATNFAEAAKSAGIKKIIYLGGLGDAHKSLSPHLQSRQEVGKILRNSGVMTIELRASIIIGSGSISFEMIRALTERLPVMILPRWVNVISQPISVVDLLEYLEQSLDVEVENEKVFEIGGPDQLSYYDLMKEYARARRLRRIMIQVPVLIPKLSSIWLGLITPVYTRVGRKIIESVKHPAIIKNKCAEKFYSVKPISTSKAIHNTLEEEERNLKDSKWTDTLSELRRHNCDKWGIKFKNRLIDLRKITVNVPPEKAFRPIAEIGGKRSWYVYEKMWRLRGIVNAIAGGTGMRLGRTQGREIAVGDKIDFWRVELFIENRYLKLKNEMKVPGESWLEYEVFQDGEKTVIQQISVYYPRGFTGILYWYLFFPFHALMLNALIKKIGELADT